MWIGEEEERHSLEITEPRKSEMNPTVLNMRSANTRLLPYTWDTHKEVDCSAQKSNFYFRESVLHGYIIEMNFKRKTVYQIRVPARESFT